MSTKKEGNNKMPEKGGKNWEKGRSKEGKINGTRKKGKLKDQKINQAWKYKNFQYTYFHAYIDLENAEKFRSVQTFQKCVLTRLEINYYTHLTSTDKQNWYTKNDPSQNLIFIPNRQTMV